MCNATIIFTWLQQPSTSGWDPGGPAEGQVRDQSVQGRGSSHGQHGDHGQREESADWREPGSGRPLRRGAFLWAQGESVLYKLRLCI